MRKPLTIKSGRSMVFVALAALFPVAAVQADAIDSPDAYRSSPTMDQGRDQSGAQGPVRSDLDSSTPTYSGEDRRPFQSETPGAEGPVRSDVDRMQRESTMQDSTRLPGDPYAAPTDSQMRGAEGPTRSELEAQGYAGDRMSQERAACPIKNSTSEKFAPNAYYGESNPFYSAEGKASFLGQGRWC